MQKQNLAGSQYLVAAISHEPHLKYAIHRIMSCNLGEKVYRRVECRFSVNSAESMPLYIRQLVSDCKLNCIDITLGKARKSLHTLVQERRLAGAFAKNCLKWDTVENVLVPVNTASVSQETACAATPQRRLTECTERLH